MKAHHVLGLLVLTTASSANARELGNAKTSAIAKAIMNEAPACGDLKVLSAVRKVVNLEKQSGQLDGADKRAAEYLYDGDKLARKFISYRVFDAESMNADVLLTPGTIANGSRVIPNAHAFVPAKAIEAGSKGVIRVSVKKPSWNPMFGATPDVRTMAVMCAYRVDFDARRDTKNIPLKVDSAFTRAGMFLQSREPSFSYTFDLTNAKSPYVFALVMWSEYVGGGKLKPSEGDSKLDKHPAVAQAAFGSMVNVDWDLAK